MKLNNLRTPPVFMILLMTPRQPLARACGEHFDAWKADRVVQSASRIPLRDKHKVLLLYACATIIQRRAGIFVKAVMMVYRRVELTCFDKFEDSAKDRSQ
jgi:hypothetical protein